jgi:monoamine oxidase
MPLRRRTYDEDFQGYLQGAVFSGQRAAAEVLDAL